ncbi:MAG: hypothetical protein K5866_06535 [Treponema sp.]|nr:hypothetical protein [Treponema sp.]
MLACNRLKSKFLFSLLFTVTFTLFAESIEMPSMPQMPSMPSISNPSLDGNFYKPSIPRPNNNSKNTEDESQNQANGVSSNTVLSDGSSTEDILSSFINNNANLTAKDISTLYDSGLFTNLSSLTGLSKEYASGITYEETNTLLKKVLESLDELKNQQKNASILEKANLTNYQTDSQTFKKRQPTILRFKLNGYSMTESFTKVFFSEPESSGSFLLSADRRYFSGQKAREETLYILFRAVSSTGTSIIYDVEPSVVQTDKNESSYIYKLSQIKTLRAEKTGNLVSIHSEENGMKVDMLLDIDY